MVSRAKKLFGKIKFKQYLSSWIFGFIASTVISLCVWFIAYYGFIDLHLPSRFDFEKINKAIQDTLPEGYSYNSYTTDAVRPFGQKSVVIYANYNKYYDTKINGYHDGVLLILDKTADDYRVSYKFQPSDDFHNKEDNFDPGLFLTATKTKDLNGDGKSEIYTSWNPIGADMGPGIVISFFEKDNKIIAKSVQLQDQDREKIKSAHNETWYGSGEMTNKFNSSEKLNYSYHEFFAFNDINELATNFVIDGNCRACDHKYLSEFFAFDGDLLKFIGAKEFNSYDDLKKEETIQIEYP